MVEWSYFNKFKEVNKAFLPDCGEGESKATQIVTAVNKLVYKFYNDGDVYDNTHAMNGWMNDLSSYANWLYNHTDQKETLKSIWDCYTDDDYENILKSLADNLLVMDKLLKQSEEPKEGSIYECKGIFKFIEEEEDEEEDWDEDEDW